MLRLIMCVGTLALVTVALLLITPPAHSAGYGPYTATNVRVIDGDTVRADIAVWPDWINRFAIRVAGVDAPEAASKQQCEKRAGLAATAFAERWFAQHPTIVISNVTRDKFAGRVVATVKSETGEEFGRVLLEAGHARAYRGGARDAWCRDQP